MRKALTVKKKNPPLAHKKREEKPNKCLEDPPSPDQATHCDPSGKSRPTSDFFQVVSGRVYLVCTSAEPQMLCSSR